MNLFSYLILPFLFFNSAGSASLTGPDITTQTTSWTAAKVTQITTGMVFTEPQKMIVYKKERIEWLDAKGTKRYNLSIQSSKGSLQVDEQGEITYQVTGEKIRGNITIKKTQTQTTIKVVLVEDNKPSIYELVVSDYTIL